MKQIHLLINAVMLIFFSSTLLAQPAGSGTEGDPYQISALSHWSWFIQNPSSWDKHFKQMNDIDFYPMRFTNWGGGVEGVKPIGTTTTPFTGTYDGQNYNIVNLEISTDYPYSEATGLFSITSDAVIKNVNLVNVSLSANNSYINGALIGQAFGGTVTDCTVSGSVGGGFLRGYDSFVGGLVGHISSSSVISGCSSSAYVYGSYKYIGGLVGGITLSSILTECSSSALVEGGYSNPIFPNLENVGGVAGLNQATISHTYFSGSFRLFGNQFGGISGSNNSDGIIYNCYVLANNLGDYDQTNVGGISGYNEGTILKCYVTGTIKGNGYLGGLISNLAQGSVDQSYFDGTLDNSGSLNIVTIGGLIGRVTTSSPASITNSFFKGSIISLGIGGGLVGEVQDGIFNITNCFTAANIAASTNAVLYVINSSTPTVQNVYYDYSLNSAQNIDGAAKTTAELQQQSTFTNWNFSTIWKINGNNYPELMSLSPVDVSSFSPVDNSSIASEFTELVLTLDEPVSAQTGKNITIYNESNSIVEQIDAASSKVNVSGNQVTITLEAALSDGDYYVMIDAGAFSAADNDEFAGIIDITTWNFTVKATDEVPGNAISFPGSGSNYVSVPYSALLNPSDNFTIEFWASIEGNQNTFSCPLSSQTTIFDGVTPISSDGYYFYAQNDNRWAAWLGRGTNDGTSTAGWEIIAGPVAQLGKWYHLAMTFSSGTMKFYVNGELQGTANGVSYTPNSSAPFNIGDLGEVQGNYPFNGKVDEVRFWNTARSQQQIQENMHLISSGDTENLVAYFQLNEGSGSTTNDILSGFIGTFSGSPTWINSSIPVGSGMSESTPSFSSGSTTLSNVMVTTTDDFDSPIDLSISQINITPNSFDGVSGTSLSDRYWNINAFGSPGTFSVNLTFTVPSDFTNEGNASAGLYTLYHRSGNDDGSWSAVISGASGLTSSSVTFEGVTSFSQFTIATTDPLPVELISFEGYKAEEGVVLNWQTATEVNNYGFEILRSAQNDTTWNNIGFVEGHGNSNSPKEYSFVDSNPMRGILQYRLKQIDTDGKFEYSEIVEVEIEEQQPTKFELYQNYPNPFNPTTTIKFSIPSVIASGAKQSSQASLKIYDILGREVATLVNENLKPGNYEVKFDAASLSSGMYFYSITTSGKTITKKMVLIR